MSKSPVIGIIGGTIWGNRGAESMLVTAIGKVKENRPDAHIIIFSYSPKKDRELVNQEDIQILSSKPASLVFRFFPFALLERLCNKLGFKLPDRLLPHVVQSLRNCDLLLDVSGITFVDGREIFLPFNILTIWPAMMLHVPVVKLSQALGPFKNPLNRTAARLFLPRCRHIFARGSTTEAHLHELGMKNFSRAADIAYLYKPEYSLSNENREKNADLEKIVVAEKTNGKRIIAFSPSSLVYEKSIKAGKDYPGRILTLVRELDDGNTIFLFLANSTREGSRKPRNNDLFVLDILQKQARETLPETVFSNTKWMLWDANTQSLRRLISLCNLLLTSRFHAMISGLSLGIPTLVIGWSHKYLEALKDFDMEQFAADFEDNKVNLSDLAHEMLANEQSIREHLSVKRPSIQASAEKQFTYLEQWSH